jgi:ribonuclease Z
MKLTFLGTAAMKPHKDRNTSAVLLTYKGENILIDCGEGTQRQFFKAKISPAKITRILISHWHGDHILGLPGLLQTLSRSDYKKTLKIYGPEGTKKFISRIMSLFMANTHKINYEVTEIKKKGIFIKEKDFQILAETLPHTSHCLGYSFRETPKRKINLEYIKKFGLKKDPILGKLQKGKTITYKGKKITPEKGTTLIEGHKVTIILDTGYTKKISKFAENSKVLVLESTFLDRDKDKAKQYQHLTAKQAATIAKESNSKQLILTHISERYRERKQIIAEAKKIFKNSKLAEDFLSINV